MARKETGCFEYKVVPAPRKGVRAKGAKTPEARFAAALMEIMNEMGAEGWEYLRADTLPCEQRSGLTGKATVYHNMLVFRRVIAPAGQEAQAGGATAAPETPATGQPAAQAPAPEAPAAKTPAPERAAKADSAPRRRLGSARGERGASEDGEAPRLGPARKRSAPES